MDANYSVPRPQESTPSPINNKGFFISFFVLLLFISFGFAWFFYYQNLQLKKQLSKKQELPKVFVSPEPKISSIILSPTLNPSLDQKQINCPKLPIVVFEPPLSSKDYDVQRTEVQQKVVDPFVEFYKAYGDNYLVSLSIQLQVNEALKNQYPYNLHGIMNNGATHAEALMQSDGKLSWWIPTCMGPCKYSEEFEQKYPQIVSLTNP